MSILVVGSVAYDTVETPFGRAERVLGGSASFFSVAASFFTPVNLVGVVGQDFGEQQLAAFARTGDRPRRASSAWRARPSTGRASTPGTSTPATPSAPTSTSSSSSSRRSPRPTRGSEVVFLGNIDPVLQREVLEQVKAPRIVACDTMNFWISGKPEELKKTLAKTQILLVNDAEARELSGEWNLVKAARAIRAMGPQTVVVKKGEHGVLMFHGEEIFSAPAFPLESVFDPTGAGDTFAGGFVGYLAGCPSLDSDALRRAIVMGSTLASFCCEAFSLDRLLTLTRPEIDARYRLFKKLTNFEAV